MARKTTEEQVTRYADMFSAIGTESRLRILRVLLSAHPDGMTVGDIGTELGIPGSTLSHHLEKLKNEELVSVKCESTYPLVLGKHGDLAGTAGISLRRVLHP